VARAVPFIRTYRPVPETARVWMPPAPVVVEKIVVNGPVGAPATWIWNDRANAASQLSVTWSIVAVAPRSTCSHCGSENALDHRLPALPSTARPAPVLAFSLDDAVAGRPWESSAPAAAARPGVTARYATSNKSAARAASSGVRRCASDMAGLLTLPGAAGPSGLTRVVGRTGNAPNRASATHAPPSTPRPGGPSATARCYGRMPTQNRSRPGPAAPPGRPRAEVL
jgi:hypothetical protein